MKKNASDLHVAIPDKLRKALEEEAQKKGLNLSNLVRMILVESLKR